MLCALKKFYNLGALGFPRGSQPPPLGPKIYIFGDSGNLVYVHWRELLPQWLGIVEGSSLERPLGLLKPHLNYKIGYGFLQYCQLVICLFMLNLRAASVPSSLNISLLGLTLSLSIGCV